jgi:hypothetical protein
MAHCPVVKGHLEAQNLTERSGAVLVMGQLGYGIPENAFRIGNDVVRPGSHVSFDCRPLDPASFFGRVRVS